MSAAVGDPATPDELIGSLDEPRRAQIEAIDRLIREEAPGLDRHLRSGMLGYGTYYYRYASGREGDWFVVGLASNKRYISVYVCVSDQDGYLAERFRERLPGADIGRSCVRFKSLDRVDEAELRALVREAARRFADDPDFAFSQ